MIKLGSHVGMNGKKMMLGSVEEALSYGADTFMIYTGAPQNTRRKELSELNIDAAQTLMKEKGIQEFIVHAPYIINLANTVKPETYELAPPPWEAISWWSTRALTWEPGPTQASPPS